MTGFAVAACAVLGLVIGSFLNVVIWRVPRGESIVRPASQCPGCGSALAVRDNVPVLSWLLLRGRCRGCGMAISRRYPLVEVGTAALFVALTVRLGPSPALPAYLYLAAVGIALAAIDIDVHRLPDALTLPSYGVGILLLGAAALADHGAPQLMRALLGMAACFAVYFALAVVYPAGMGFGDVKLAGLLGLYLGWLGWAAWAVGLFAGFFLGGAAGLVLLALGRASRKTALPFGPFMLTGAALAILFGEPIARVWLPLSG
jgi:leader peptidase (prepilin peptidase)/N-methyltransferase